jgi:succinoglycan biosynthesis protein ExoM
LRELATQVTDDLFTYSIVVVDNDRLESAKEIVWDFMSNSKIPALYCIEPRQNIALARNMAIANAVDGDFIAFIDDDEFPVNNWLLNLFKACGDYGVDGVLGPVRPYFNQQPPKWVIAGKLYSRSTYPTGFIIDWTKGRTGNVLLNKRVFSAGELPFRPEFRTGEDQDFFRRAIENGYVFIWCNEALAYELVPPIRWKCSFLLKRALLQGATRLSPSYGDLVKSCIAVCVYLSALPLVWVLGLHHFMMILIKLFYHLGRLLAGAGINPISSSYVTE